VSNGPDEERRSSDQARDLPAALGRLASGVAAEARWTAQHLARYPLGLLGDRHPARTLRERLGRSARQRGLLHHNLEAAATPILSVHGIIDNHTIFSTLERTLRREGFSRLASFDYGLLTRDIRAAAQRLGHAVDGLATATNSDQIKIIGHSLGGLIARYYVQRMGGDALVDTLITLGTPHAGTVLAKPAAGSPLARVVPLLRQLSPDSDLIRELAEPAPGCRTRFVAVSSDLDHLIRPTSNGNIDHPDLQVRNFAVRGVGHLSLTNSPLVADLVTQALIDRT
jgi:pimeloyl-ACP methyl ester carboxylesterase